MANQLVLGDELSLPVLVAEMRVGPAGLHDGRQEERLLSAPRGVPLPGASPRAPGEVRAVLQVARVAVHPRAVGV